MQRLRLLMRRWGREKSKGSSEPGPRLGAPSWLSPLQVFLRHGSTVNDLKVGDLILCKNSRLVCLSRKLYYFIVTAPISKVVISLQSTSFRQNGTLHGGDILHSFLVNHTCVRTSLCKSEGERKQSTLSVIFFLNWANRSKCTQTNKHF